MEIAPVAGIRAVNLFAPWRVDGKAPAFVVDASARADDEQRRSSRGDEQRGLEEDVALELEADETEQPQRAGEWIDVTA